MKVWCAIGWWLVSVSAMAAEFRDPTQPDEMQPNAGGKAGAGQEVGAEAAAGKDALTLTGIVGGADRRLAIINGKAVKEGDDIGGAQVMSIDATHVELVRANDEKALQHITLILARDFKVQAQP